MEGFIQSLENLVNSHQNSFDKGLRLNKQLKLLEIYLKNVYTDPEKYGAIDTKNQHYEAYSSPEFDMVLISMGFCREEDLLRFTGSLEAISLDFVMKQLQDHRQLSFAELVEMVEKGETPPGIKQILEQPIGIGEVLSQTTRPKKPWIDI